MATTTPSLAGGLSPFHPFFPSPLLVLLLAPSRYLARSRLLSLFLVLLSFSLCPVFPRPFAHPAASFTQLATCLYLSSLLSFLLLASAGSRVSPVSLAQRSCPLLSAPCWGNGRCFGKAHERRERVKFFDVVVYIFGSRMGSVPKAAAMTSPAASKVSNQTV